MAASLTHEGSSDRFEEAERERMRVKMMGYTHCGIPMSSDHAHYLFLRRYPSFAKAFQELLRPPVSNEPQNAARDNIPPALVNNILPDIQRDPLADVHLELESIHARY